MWIKSVDSHGMMPLTRAVMHLQWRHAAMCAVAFLLVCQTSTSDKLGLRTPKRRLTTLSPNQSNQSSSWSIHSIHSVCVSSLCHLFFLLFCTSWGVHHVRTTLVEKLKMMWILPPQNRKNIVGMKMHLHISSLTKACLNCKLCWLKLRSVAFECVHKLEPSTSKIPHRPVIHTQPGIPAVARKTLLRDP